MHRKIVNDVSHCEIGTLIDFIFPNVHCY
jgi:hypothetical protein